MSGDQPRFQFVVGLMEIRTKSRVLIEDRAKCPIKIKIWLQLAGLDILDKFVSRISQSEFEFETFGDNYKTCSVNINVEKI